jgi:hypothetical protein
VRLTASDASPLAIVKTAAWHRGDLRHSTGFRASLHRNLLGTVVRQSQQIYSAPPNCGKVLPQFDGRVSPLRQQRHECQQRPNNSRSSRR